AIVPPYVAFPIRPNPRFWEYVKINSNDLMFEGITDTDSGSDLAQVYQVELSLYMRYFTVLKKVALHLIAPLFDQESQRLSRQYIRALERIFILCDHDMDGALNDHKLNEFQTSTISELVDVKRIMWERVPEGVNKYGITMFGYNNNIELPKENIDVPSKKDPGQIPSFHVHNHNMILGFLRLLRCCVLESCSWSLSRYRLVPSCYVIFDLEPFLFDFDFNSEIFKSLSLRSL
ncbi:mitochondrial Rho GTPase 2-like protein, partial [Tanacetum coccineum]